MKANCSSVQHIMWQYRITYTLKNFGKRDQLAKMQILPLRLKD